MALKDIPLNERIIFALDVDSPEEARYWVDHLGSHIHFFKVGLQLFIAGWFHVIDMITERGHKVMCDLKLFDIPETVRLAVRRLRGHGITLATVHGNSSIIEAAVGDKGEIKILAITALTSLGEEDMKEMGYFGKIEDLVFHRARSAREAGCDGVVSSGLEALRLRENLDDDLLIVTPGIRSGESRETARDDQKRIVTAGEAVRNGADYIVVGRPIRSAADPIAVVESLQTEIQNGLLS
jgi:orotidine-5'-phosphate decarboxylase